MATSKVKTKSVNLKDPKSPVSGWKHYGIFSYTEQRVRQLLEETGYQAGYLVGLQVGYEYRKRPYMMAFGFGVGEQAQKLMPDPGVVLGEGLFITLFQEVRQLFDENSTVSGKLQPVMLDIAISGSLFQVSYKCDLVQAGECTANPPHTGQMMVLSQLGDGAWTCTHQPC